MKRFFSISLLIPASLWAQFHFGDLQREVAPFPVSDATGTQLTYPFLGGFNRPRPQFVDFDNDGDPDLFLQENEGAIMYFENSGTDGQPVFLLTEDQFAGINPGAWFRVVDLDSDGDFDILCEWGVARMAWYRNDGSPGNPVFATVFTDLADNNRNPISPERTNLPALTDIDCDGDPDLFLGRSSGSVTHYRHDGFQPDGRPVFQFITDRFEDILIIGITKDNSAKHGANALFFNDMDNDNDPDLIWGDFFSRSLYYLENIGTCQQAEIDTAAIVDGYPVNAPVWTSGFNVPSFCDIDGDNDADLFVTIMGGVYYNGYEKLSNFYFYRNTGNAQSAQFNLETRQFLDGIDFGQYSHPAAADLDDDGDLDFIIGNESNPGGDGGQLYLLTNTGSAFDPALAVSDSNYLNFHSGYRFAPALVDIDNDGDFDLFVGESDGKLDLFRNDGSASSAQFELEDGNFAAIDVGTDLAPAFADLDGDGDFDLLAGQASGDIDYFRNDGDSANPQFVAAEPGLAGIDVGSASRPALFDYDLDNDLDLFVAASNGYIYRFRNTGNSQQPQFSAQADDSLRSSLYGSVLFCDIDGNGSADLFTGALTGGMLFFRNNPASLIPGWDSEVQPPEYFVLGAAYPNPFKGSTRIPVYILKDSPSGHFAVYNNCGQLVFTRPFTGLSAGTTITINFNGNGLPSGVYFYRFHASGSLDSKKVLLLR